MSRKPHVNEILFPPVKPSNLQRTFMWSSKCEECGEKTHHKADCASLTIEQLRGLAYYAQEKLKKVEERWEKAWRNQQILAGKVAVLRHENNKLRANNNKLIKENSTLKEKL